MNSIRTKLLVLISGAIIGVFILVSAVAFYSMQNVMEDDSEVVLKMISEERCRELNVHFQIVERAVETLENYVEEKADPDRLYVDAEYTRDFIEELSIRCLDAAKVTGNVETVYYRADPLKYGSTGIFLTNNGAGNYISMELTDVLAFDRSDKEHVGWYYEPIDRGRAIWMEPYFNKNINVYMISYVTPVYSGSKLLGVVGMDINMAQIHSVVDSINYNNGFGFLLGENGNIIYHKEYPEGLSSVLMDDDLKSAFDILSWETAVKGEIHRYRWRGKMHRLVTGDLENGMIFAISVPEGDIMKSRRSMQRDMVIVLVITLFIILGISWRVMTRIARPIRELTEASSHIAKGELGITISHHSSDEIGQLAGSIRSMQKELREYFSYVHEQAYTDAMTGVGNKSAYMNITRSLERKIEEKLAEFAIVVFDVNGLKTINDDHGHEYGDMLITDSAAIMKNVFGAGNIYRIGGDEFIVILDRTTQEEVDALMKEMDDEIGRFNNGGNKRYDWPLAISKGAAVYDVDGDEAFRDVFKRADQNMYRDKAAYYQRTGDRRRRR